MKYEGSINLLEAFIDALLNKHKNNDANDRNQQLHQICVKDIPKNFICKEKDLQHCTMRCSFYSKYYLYLMT